MADYMSETAPGAEQGNYHQSTPSGPKRNNRNRKNNQYVQVDGAMSDGALINPTLSPRPRKAKQQRQSVAIAPTQQQHDNMGQGNAQRARPVSYAGGRVPATPAKEQAYAGPTFQASPAASSLPMPKFSKSVPNAGMRGSLSARLAAEKKSDGEQSSPETDSAAPAPPSREAMNSPLDLFFKADREEKARSGSGSLSPEMARRSQPPASQAFGPKSQSAFINDVNGDMDMPSPRTIPTNSERPHMVHRTVSSPGAPQQVNYQSEEQRLASTQKLKSMLWSTAGPATNLPNSSQLRTPSNPATPNGYFNSPSPFNRPGTDSRHSSGPSTPQPTYEQQQQDNYSLHYGNKNLSPLFKASRSETPPRPSSLRQEVASDTSSDRDSGVAIGDPYSPNTQARNYLHQTARAAGPIEMPQFPFNNHPSSFHGPSIGSSTQPVNAQHGVPAQAANTSSNGNDLRDMSADLRRMLRI